MLWGNRQFGGLRPRVSPRLLPDTNAQTATNCWLDRGYPRPVPEPREIANVPAFDGNVKTIYRYDGATEALDRWFQWDEYVDVVLAPVIGDTTNRIIWTGDLYPRHTSTAILQADTSPFKPISRRLGIPVPEVPTISLSALTDADNTQIEESHAWIYTWLSDLDEEGPPSPPTSVINRGFNVDGSIQPVVITFPGLMPGDRGINRRRIYRTVTGASGVTTYSLVATITSAVASYTDEVQTVDLGDGLVSLDWDPPPEGLQGLIALPNGVLCGFEGRDVWFSVPYQAHAWPVEYVQTVDADIVGLDAAGVTVVVGTKGVPYLISGQNPATASPARMEFNQSCAAKRSFAYIDQQGLVYASPEGLVLVGPGGGRFLSREFYDRANWKALNPDQFRAFFHDGSYIAFTDSKVLAFNPEMDGPVEILDSDVHAIFHDQGRDKIYIVDGSDDRLKEWKTEASMGDTMKTMTWKSKLYVGQARTFSAAQVIAEDYDITFKLYGDGVETVITVGNDDPFRLPEVGLNKNWEYEISGTSAVIEVRIGSMNDMLGT